MAKSLVSTFILLQAVFCLVFLPVSFSDDKLIQSTCKKTPFFDLCVSTLKADPKSSTADVAGLAHIAADGVNAKATPTLNQIKVLLESAKEPKLRKALEDCVSKYEAIVTADIPVAIEAIVKGNPKFAVTSATDAANEAQSCERGFTDPPKSPISVSNKLVHDLSLVLESIASLLL